MRKGLKLFEKKKKKKNPTQTVVLLKFDNILYRKDHGLGVNFEAFSQWTMKFAWAK